MSTNNTPSSSESDPERRAITTTEKGKCYFALIHAEPLKSKLTRILPNTANADVGQSASSDSSTHKVIAIPRFDLE